MKTKRRNGEPVQAGKKDGRAPGRRAKPGARRQERPGSSPERAGRKGGRAPGRRAKPGARRQERPGSNIERAGRNVQRTPERAKSAGVVAYRETPKGRLFLLLNYPQGHWDFVKGHVEEGETDIQAAVREAREETGITDLVFRDGFKRTVKYTFYIPGGRAVHKSVVFFLARTQTAKVVISDEHQGYSWDTMDAAIKKATFENARKVLEHARDYMDKAAAAERGSSELKSDRPAMR